MKWHILEDCSNSPKNKMLVDWTVALVESNEPMPFVTDDSLLTFKGEETLLKDFNILGEMEEIALEKAITHGRDGALLGSVIRDGKTYPFVLFFEFSLGKQPKIKTLNCIVETI